MRGGLFVAVAETGSARSHSLVQEGKQVAHDHQRGPGHAQQDLADALRPLVHVLDPWNETKRNRKKMK